MTLTVNEFEVLVVEWANANAAQIRQVWMLAGGWEGWAQVSIAAYVNHRDAESWIDREPRIYVDGSRADFLVNNPLVDGADQALVVELKCQSLRNWRAFVDGLRADAYQLDAPMRLDLDGASKICVGIFFAPETEEELAMLAGFNVSYAANGEIGLAFLHWQNDMAAQLPPALVRHNAQAPRRPAR